MTVVSHAPEEGPAKGEPKAASRRRGRRRGLEIRPGSVREARARAGLSLGQVARDDISRTAIYFVETGKAKPSRETLELIAERTGQPLDFFLTGAAGSDRHPGARLAELDRLLATGDNAGVVAAAEATLGQGYDDEAQAQTRLIASLAYLRLGQFVVGRRLAATARAHFERRDNLEMIAACLANEAQAAMSMQDPSAASMAEGALTTCRSVKPVPRMLEVRLLGILGNTLVQAQRWQEAIACYEQAIDAGDVVHDLRQLSLLYSGLSLSHQEMGQIGEATRYAQKALTLHETLNDRMSQARSLNNLGWMLVNLGEFAAARRHLTQALQIFEENGVEPQKSEILMSLAGLELREGHPEAAAESACRSLEQAMRLGEMATAAEAHALLGRVAAARGEDARADDEFSAALAAAAAAGGARRAGAVHEAYAEVLQARGDLAAANIHLKQALAAMHPAAAEARIAIA